MKRKKRIIQDDFPTGSLDREALTQAFVELREKRLARLRREAVPAAPSPAPEAPRTRRPVPSAVVEGNPDQNRAA